MAQRGNQIVRILKGMNLDVAREYIKDAATFLKNCISDFNFLHAGGVTLQSGQNHNAGIITPTNSVAIAFNPDEFPAGQNICIGSYYDRRLNQFFYFIWNSNNLHSLYVTDFNVLNAAGAGINTLILQTSQFNFDLHHLVNNINVVVADVSSGLNVQNLQRLIYFTDGFNPPRKLNVDVAIAGGYGALTNLRTTDEFINEVKYPPLDITITTTLTNPDPTYPLNFVANKQFQFGAQYYYQDGEHTTRGAISTFAYNIAAAKNFIELTVGAGSSLVTYVVLYYRLGNIGDWKQFDRIKRSVIVANVVYPYDAGTNTFKYKFFNNQQYNVVDQEDIERLFDLVPQKAFSQEYVENNLLLYGYMLEGYDNLDAEQLALPEIVVAYGTFAPLTLTLNMSIAHTDNPGDIPEMEVHKIDYNTGVDTVVDTQFIVANPEVYSVVITNIDYGDIIYLEAHGNVLSTINNTSTLTGTYTNISQPIACGTGNFSVLKNGGNQNISGAGVSVVFNTVVSDTCSTWDSAATMTRHTNPNTNAIGIAQLKQGGRYKVGLICYDAALRSTFVQELDDGDINIESIQENGAFQTFTITVNWNNIIFPDWVYYVKLCRTKNLNVDRTLGEGYLQFGITFSHSADPETGFVDNDGVISGTASASTKKIAFKLTELIIYNTDNFENTTTTYTYTEGDRVQFVRNGNGTYFDFATYGLIDVALSNSPVAPDVLLLADYNAGLSGLTNGAWVELYTPNKQPITDLFYEIGDFMPTNRVMSRNQLTVSSTVVDTFDTYPIFWTPPYIQAAVNDTGVTPFEHHSVYTEIVPSNGEDIGRINVVNVDARQLWYPARIRKSKAYIPNSFYNGLSTFYDEDRTDLNRADGGIKKLSSEGYKLFAFQEDRVVGVMMAKQLVTLADGGQQLIAAAQFFSDPVIFDGYFGLQNAESFVVIDNSRYFNDTKRGAYIEFDGQKLTDISREGFVKSYAEYKIGAARKYNSQEYINEKCCWDTSGFPTMSSYWYVNILIDGEYETATVPLLTILASTTIYFSFTGAPTVADNFVITLKHTNIFTGVTTNVSAMTITFGDVSPKATGGFFISNVGYGDIIWWEITAVTFAGGVGATINASSQFLASYINTYNLAACAVNPEYGGFTVYRGAAAQTVVLNDHVEFDNILTDTCSTWSLVLFQHTSANGRIDTIAKLASLINSISPFNTLVPQVIVEGSSLCFWNSAMKAEIGNILIFNSADVLQDTLPLVCSVDYIINPSGYNPKQKQYVTTYFNINTKAHYAYNISAGFTTGESVLVSIDINGAVQTNTLSILGLADLQAVLIDLIEAYITGLPTGVTVTDILYLVDNDTVFYLTSSTGYVYGDIVVGAATYTPDSSTTQYKYLNNEYNIAAGVNKTVYPIVSANTEVVEMERAETIAWSVIPRNWNTFYAFTPERYTFADGSPNYLLFVSFKDGMPFFHNVTIGYNEFYGYATCQVIEIICNEGAATEKRFATIMLDIKNPNSPLSSIKYSAYEIITSDSQRSVLPIECFEFRENRYWAAFRRNTSLGGSIITGEQLRGTWIQIKLLRDTTEPSQSSYNEFSKAIINFVTSSKTY